MQFAPKEYHFGEDLGRQLGSGLTGSLNSLAQFKLQDIMRHYQENQTRQAYEKMQPGLGWLANVPQQVQKSYIENLINEHPELIEQQQGIQGTQNIMGQYNQMQPENQMINQLNQISQHNIPVNTEQEIGNVLNGMLGYNVDQIRQGDKSLQPIIEPRQAIKVGIPARSAIDEKYNIPAGLTRQQRVAFLKDAVKEERMAGRVAEKESKPVIKSIREGAKEAKATDLSLKRMEELISTKKLTRPRTRAFLNALEHGLFGMGLDLHSLESPESQEFDKLSKSMLKNAKNIFGSRITDIDLKAFLKTIPDLTQSREGKRRIIYNMKLLNEGVKVRSDTMEQILRENKGRAPSDLEAVIEERAKDKLDLIADKLNQGYQKPRKEKPPVYMPKLKNPITGLLNIALGKG